MTATTLVAMACATSGTPPRPRVVMMASTIGPVDSGIVGALEDAFRKRTGIDVPHAGAQGDGDLGQTAGIEPSGPWYVTFEQGAAGNAATTRYADQRQAYVLMDRATVLTLEKDLRLQVLVVGLTPG